MMRFPARPRVRVSILPSPRFAGSSPHGGEPRPDLPTSGEASSGQREDGAGEISVLTVDAAGVLHPDRVVVGAGWQTGRVPAEGGAGGVGLHDRPGMRGGGQDAELVQGGAAAGRGGGGEGGGGGRGRGGGGGGGGGGRPAGRGGCGGRGRSGCRS